MVKEASENSCLKKKKKAVLSLVGLSTAPMFPSMAIGRPTCKSVMPSGGPGGHSKPKLLPVLRTPPTAKGHLPPWVKGSGMLLPAQP